MNPTTVRYVLISNVKRFPEFEVVIGFICPNCRKLHYKTIRDVAPLPTEIAWKLRCGFVYVVLPWKDELPVTGQPVASIATDRKPGKAEV